MTDLIMIMMHFLEMTLAPSLMLSGKAFFPFFTFFCLRMSFNLNAHV